MPVPRSVRRAAREGGNVGKAPTGTAPATPVQETPQETSSGLFILEVKSANLKENRNGPYRSVTGVAADGKLYWAPLDSSHKPVPGQMITLKGEFKGTFGGEDGKPEFRKILGPNYFAEVDSIMDKSSGALAPAQVSSADTDELLKTLETLVKTNGIGKILTVLGEIT